MAESNPDLPRTRLATEFVRFARQDWHLLITGTKREYRIAGRFAPSPRRDFQTPIPIVGYSFGAYRDDADTAMFMLTGAHQEPLGAISPASLEREGFETVTEFRAYWRERHPRAGFRPLSKVWALELRPFLTEDIQPAAARLMQRLYGRWLA